jgi:hypothetical protein
MLRIFRTSPRESFGIMDIDGNTWFVEAARCKLRRGDLIFEIGLRTIVAVAAQGTWQRVMRGISLEDFESKE